MSLTAISMEEETKQQLYQRKAAFTQVAAPRELSRHYANQTAKRIVKRLRYRIPAYLDWAGRCDYIKDFLCLCLRDELRKFQVSPNCLEYAFQLVASQFVEELKWLDKQGRL